MTYDGAGNVLTVSDANGRVTTNAYDALNRLKSTRQSPDANSANDILVRNDYDAAGNRTAVIDGKNQRTEFTYDGFNRNLTVKDPASRTVTFAYNALNKTSRLDSMGQETTYAYDARHRLTDVTYVGRTQDNRAYAYDAVGRLLAVTEPGKSVANAVYTYDALGRQLTEISSGEQHTYAYDLIGNRVTVTYGGTSTVLTSTYDVLNRLATLTEGARVTTYGYDLNGNRVFQSLPNGEETDTTFDALNRQTGIVTTKSGGGTLLELVQAYDLVGNVSHITESYPDSMLSGRTVTNTYDGVNRLVGETTVESAKTVATVYTFDKANNRTVRAVATATGSGTTVVTTAYVYNNLNQLQTATEGSAVTGFSYDLNGNRATRTKAGQTETYVYDYENRLLTLTDALSSGSSALDYAYTYDYRTRRVERTEAGVVTKSVFSGGVSVSEYLGGSPAVASVEYIRGSDWGGGVGGLLYSVRSGTPSFKHYNSRGDVISETNTAGAATWQGTYEAYGTRTQEIGTTEDRQKANTKEEDPTGLLNEGFRYRCLETGVFITRDPLGFVDGPNMYAYVVQNPWSQFDPEGLKTRKEREERKKRWDAEYEKADKEQQELKGRQSNGVWSNAADEKRYDRLFAKKAFYSLAAQYEQNQIDKIDQTARVISWISKRTVEEEAAELDDEGELYNEGRKLVAAGIAAEQVSAYYGGKLIGWGAGKIVGKIGVLIEQRTARHLAKLSRAGEVLDKGGLLTKAGRAAQKHGSRPGSVFPPTTGNPASINQQGQSILDNILASPRKTIKPNRFGGQDIHALDGRGARFNGAGEFMGFLEPS
jgi:RHS repeat-associated protein